MKTPAFLLAALALGFAAGGCQQLDLTPEGDPQRVVTGHVTLGAETLFPPGTEVVVRVVDTMLNERPNGAAGIDIPVVDRAKPIKSERVLGDDVILSPGVAPVPFRIEFEADDAMLRRGLTIDVRISFDGRVQYRTLTAHMLTLSGVRYPQEVAVQPVR
jgi:uncharacterized lipoprotein YbaY